MSWAARVREMALWEDRSVSVLATDLQKPQNHAEIVGHDRHAEPNDPPRAPKLRSARMRRRAQRRGGRTAGRHAVAGTKTFPSGPAHSSPGPPAPSGGLCPTP